MRKWVFPNYDLTPERNASPNEQNPSFYNKPQRQWPRCTFHQVSTREQMSAAVLKFLAACERTLRPQQFMRVKGAKDYEYPNHPQSTQHQKNDRCPPPPQMLPERACEVPGCRSDSECERHKRCCYNGCIYACLESVQPPPVLDWLVQPKPRWLGGNGWLLDGPEEMLQAEACSTTEDGDEPLHCPTGYECHIINPGNPAAGIPNRGQCIKQRANSDGRGLRHKLLFKDYLGK
ncbi:WAP four-disulfide core domain protein 1 isoform X2 [Phyllopteryx taeniolatus]|uniref:WAP four-disulfide core domain protein 1 isoform X2 n=1 Tax=Phyllopteryx taeniolatus TaxID=161469 RepID=UPI002AD34C61|nr:WAP four-disulfide core domain protein 1 isoform X2 [Phyllopteryx taeniolatus]